VNPDHEEVVISQSQMV